MTAETRERVELDEIRPKLVQKLEGYLRAHFDGTSANMVGDALERLLLQVGADWLINRGIPASEWLLKDAVRDAAARYMENWNGKKQGEDDRSHALGRALYANTKEYGI